jgi:hypothetical protein
MKTSKTEMSVGAAVIDTALLAYPLNVLHSARRRALVGELSPSMTADRWARLSSPSAAGAVLDAAGRLGYRLPYFGVSTVADAYLGRDLGAIASVVVGAPLASFFGVPVGQFAGHGRNVKLRAGTPSFAFAGYGPMVKSEAVYTAACLFADRATRKALEDHAGIPADTRDGAQYGAATVAGIAGGVLASVVSHPANCMSGFSQLLGEGQLSAPLGAVHQWPEHLKRNALRALTPRLGIGALAGGVAAVGREFIASKVQPPPTPGGVEAVRKEIKL